MPSPDERLNRECLGDWFTMNNKLQPNYMHVMELYSAMKPNQKIVHALSKEYPTIHDFFIDMLQKMK
jgi:hypothetical protein